MSIPPPHPSHSHSHDIIDVESTSVHTNNGTHDNNIELTSTNDIHWRPNVHIHENDNENMNEKETNEQGIENQQAVIPKPIHESASSTTLVIPEGDDEIRAPHLSYWKLFLLFLGFGVRAWGGPMAQIAMVKDQLVIKERWVSIHRFHRVFAIYQILPGPEAFELCCYFGVISRGRIGGILAGLGFMLPGLACMLLLSWIYAEYGRGNDYFEASFQGIQPAVAAMVARGVHRIGDDAVRSGTPRVLDYWLVAMVLISAIQSLMRINFLITNAFCGILYTFYRRGWYIAMIIESALGILVYALVTAYVGALDAKATATGLGEHVNPGSIFLIGLLGGLLSFGGAYAAVPFIQAEVTVRAIWMTKTQFLDGLALSAIIPAPMVIFATFVGYSGGDQLGWGIGGQFLAALLATCGMFLPAFSFTALFHHWFERVLAISWAREFLEGVTASVVGLIAITSLDIIRSAVAKKTLTITHMTIAQVNPLSSIIFMCSLYALYQIKHRAVNIIVVIVAAIVGQVFFAPQDDES